MREVQCGEENDPEGRRSMGEYMTQRLGEVEMRASIEAEISKNKVEGRIWKNDRMVDSIGF